MRLRVVVLPDTDAHLDDLYNALVPIRAVRVWAVGVGRSGFGGRGGLGGRVWAGAPSRPRVWAVAAVAWHAQTHMLTPTLNPHPPSLP